MEDQYKIAIIKTLAYFELFEMPLTFFELQRHLYWPHRDEIDVKALRKTIGILDRTGEVFTYEGYYALSSDIKERLGLRKAREKRALSWLKRAKPWLAILAAWPGVEMIAICNNLALLQAKEKSDIDLFVITQPGKIWQTRFFMATFLHLFKKRTTPHSEDTEKFCLSFFVTSNALDLSSIKLEDEDIYLSYWLSTLIPFYDPMNRLHDVYAKNHHLVQRVKRTKQEQLSSMWSIDHDAIGFRLLELITNQASWFPHLLERFTRNWQQKHFPETIKHALEQDGNEVVVNETMLKFHTNDRRKQFLDRWNNRCKALLN